MLEGWGSGGSRGRGTGKRTGQRNSALTCFPLHEPHVRGLGAFEGLHHLSNLHGVLHIHVKASAANCSAPKQVQGQGCTISSISRALNCHHRVQFFQTRDRRNLTGTLCHCPLKALHGPPGLSRGPVIYRGPTVLLPVSCPPRLAL